MKVVLADSPLCAVTWIKPLPVAKVVKKMRPRQSIYLAHRQQMQPSQAMIQILKNLRVDELAIKLYQRKNRNLQCPAQPLASGEVQKFHQVNYRHWKRYLLTMRWRQILRVSCLLQTRERRRVMSMMTHQIGICTKIKMAISPWWIKMAIP